MGDESKTKEELIDELNVLRKQLNGMKQHSALEMETSEHKRVEKTLDESQKVLETIIETAPT